MTNNQLNEPAFQIRGGLHEHQFVGASLRDYFAAKAMQASMSLDPANAASIEEHARWAYEMADAMLRVRQSK